MMSVRGAVAAVHNYDELLSVERMGRPPFCLLTETGNCF